MAHAHQVPTSAAMTIGASDWTQHPTTATALRAFGMRRSSVRSSGKALPVGPRRSVGSTSGSSSAPGTIVGVSARVGSSVVTMA